MFGQEKISTAKTRTLGTIESFLLMTEWHPRSLHFPPQSDGWDVALLAPDAPDVPEVLEAEENSALYRWREEVRQNHSAVLSRPSPRGLLTRNSGI